MAIGTRGDDNQTRWTTAHVTVTVRFARPTRIEEPIPSYETRSISQYLPFTVLLDRGATGVGYRARVIESPAGEARIDFSLPFTSDELAGLLGSLSARKVSEVRAFGSRLFETVFDGAVGVCLQQSISEAERLGAGLRIRLRFEASLSELANLPWEFLFDADLNRFLALSNRTSIARQILSSRPVLPALVQLPLTILTVISTPSDLSPFPGDSEWSRLKIALEDQVRRGLVRLERLTTATAAGLLDRLSQDRVHILHFIGHAVFDQSQNEGGLVFEDEAAHSDRVSATSLGGILSSSSELRLVVLNVDTAAQRERTNPSGSVAQRMALQGIPAVLAMQFPMREPDAVTLTRTFYSALAAGVPVDAALSEARRAVFAGGDDFDWAAPVLYVSSLDDQLFEPSQGKESPRSETKPFEPETILIPGGPFLMGSQPGPDVPAFETPQHEVTLSDFRTGKYPVTNRQYAAFVKAKRDQPAPQDWFNREPPPDRLDHPVTGVSWHDAVAYCVWLSEQTGWRYVLPSEAEWEKAASGPAGGKRRYTWGDEWADGLCTVGGSGTAAVTAHPDGASAYGVEDLLGNVEEWTRSLWGGQPNRPEYAYPYDPSDGREVFDPGKLPDQAHLVHRGGSFRSSPADLRCSARGNALADSRVGWRGFRVALAL